MLNERTLSVVVRTKEPFRIGGKQDPLSGADNPVTKVGGRLVIPGSTLKGALRARIEEFLIDTYYSNGSWKNGYEDFMPCIPGAKGSISNDEKLLMKSRKYRNQEETCHYPCDDRRCGNGVNHSICPVCYLLGSMGLNGFVKVPFLYAEGSPSELYSSRIDRATRTVAKGTNRPYELVSDGTAFTGQLIVLLEDSVLGWKLGEPRQFGESRTNGDKWLDGSKGKADEGTQQKIMDEYIIERLRSIDRIGGFKSKGFGSVEVEIK
jgi:CRISPR/Cas system CSM-associated protein Csm3 (group 7 of RAMP superfamily)